MSRIGKAPITVPAGVTVSVAADNGQVDPEIKINIQDGVLTVERPSDAKNHKALHGLYRALLFNMVTGVSEGYKTVLEIVGVGYKVSVTGQMLDLSLGFSHNLFIELPAEIKAEAVSEKGKNPLLTLTSHDKELLGLVVAKIRSFRKPEPYKGKGIKFQGEVLRRKAGKSASSK